MPEIKLVRWARVILFSPCLLFCFLWAANISGHLLLPDSLGSISNYTLFLSLAFVACFVLSFIIFKGVWFRTLPPVSAMTSELRSPWVGIFLVSAMVVMYLLLINSIFSVNLENPQQYRNLINKSYSEKNNLFYILQGFTALFFLFSFRYMTIKNAFNLNLLFALLVCLPFGGRNFLLFLGIFFSVKFFSEFRKAGDLLWVLLFVFSLFFITLIPIVLFGKIEEPKSTSLGLGVLRSYSSYFFNPLRGFSWIIEQNKTFGDVAFLSDGVVRKIAQIFDFSYETFPEMPYAPPPFVTNVYTVMWPIYHDLGVWGILALGFSLGCLHAFLSRKLFCRAGFYLYLYAASLYPLIMSGFHDTYFSSFGLWVWVLLPVAFRLRINYSSRVILKN